LLGQSPQGQTIGTVPGYAVRVAYIIPSNRVPQPHGAANLQNAIVQYQNWYRDQMERHGFGSKSFRCETEVDGVTPKVHIVNVPDTDDYLRGDLWTRTIEAAAAAGVPVWTPKQVWWLVAEAHLQGADGAISGGTALGASFGSGDDPGVAMVGSDALVRFEPDYLTNDTAYPGQIIPAIGPYPLVESVSFPWFEGTTFSSISSSVLGAGVHEISHGLGLPHDFRNDQNFNGNLMGNGLRGLRGSLYPDRYPFDYTRAAYGAALALSVSRYFNPDGTFPDNTKPSLAISTTGAISPVAGLARISFSASDVSGLAVAWLQWNGDLVGEMALAGTSTSQTFATPYYIPGQANSYAISVFDSQGNKQSVETSIVPATGFNRAPQPFITVSNPTARVGSDVTLDASASTDPDGDAAVMQVEWDLNGDFAFDTSPTTIKTLTYQFTTPGDWLVRARLTDSFGAQSVSAPIAVRVLPVIESAYSVGQHGSEGLIHLPLNLSGIPTTDPRSTVDEILVVFTAPVGTRGGGVSPDDVNITSSMGNPIPPYTVSFAGGALTGNELTIHFSGSLPDQDRYHFSLSGFIDTKGDPLLGDTDFELRVLRGDANNNGAVTATDVSFVRSRINQPVAFGATSRADVNMNGSITGPDVSFVRSRIGHSAP
jgi:hypothetical protein